MRCRKISIWSMIVCKTYPYVCFGAYKKFGTTILKRITRLHAHWKPSFSRRKNSTSKSISLTIFQYFSIFCVASFFEHQAKTVHVSHFEYDEEWKRTAVASTTSSDESKHIRLNVLIKLYFNVFVAFLCFFRLC